MQENKKSIVLPEKFSIDKVPGVANEIKRLAKDQSIEIDFKNTRAFDSSGIAFINYLKGNRKNVSLKNLKPEFEKIFSMFPPVEKDREEKSQEKTIMGKITQVTRIKPAITVKVTVLARGQRQPSGILIVERVVVEHIYVVIARVVAGPVGITIVVVAVGITGPERKTQTRDIRSGYRHIGHVGNMIGIGRSWNKP